MADLTSALVPPVGAGDHVRGEGAATIVYADLACPYCAAAWPEIAASPTGVVFRHFPMGRRRPRSPVLHAAAEAAGLQGSFFEMVALIYGDQGHVDDPHLWRRAEELGLEVGRFDRDRRSEAVDARVRRDFESGVRAGVVRTPAIFAGLPPENGQ